ncbi:CrcB family protein [Rhodococcus sp. WS4]|nr:CrcB family protein [Rhodococcus sp. WS4]
MWRLIRTVASHTSHTAAIAVAVAAGGALGAALRYQLWRWWPDETGSFPLTTFLINVVGCFIFGICVARIPERDRGVATLLRPFLTFGALGGFTTFSFYAVQGVTLTSPRLGALYLVVTPVVAVGAALIGRRVGRHAQ